MNSEDQRSTTEGEVANRDTVVRLDNWLRSETTKLSFSSLDTHRKTRRASAVLLWSAAAYVSIATLGQAEAEVSRNSRLFAVKDRLGQQEGALRVAKSSESAAFAQSLDVYQLVTELEGVSNLAGKDVEISESVASRDKLKSAEAQRVHDAARRALLLARDASSAYDSKLVPGERREELLRRSGELRARVLQAQVEVDRTMAALEQARKNERAAAGIEEPSPGAEVPPVKSHLTHREALEKLAIAKVQHAAVTKAWETSHRDLLAAQAKRDEIASERDRLEQDPDSLSLPVVGLTVGPKHFYLLSPLLLLVLFWNFANNDHAFRKLHRKLHERVRSLECGDLSPSDLVEALEVGHKRWIVQCRMLFPDLTVMACLGFLLWAGSGVASAFALGAALLTSIMRVRAYGEEVGKLPDASSTSALSSESVECDATPPA